jgi:hypothetical protein
MDGGVKVYLEHKATKRRFEVVSLDKERGKVTLKGPHSTFEENWNPAQFKMNGYTLVKEAQGDD